MTRRSTLFAVFALGLLAVLGSVWLSIAHRTSPAPERLSSTSAQLGGPFTLRDTNGKTVTDQTYRGKWLLIYFGYTSCPDACPTALNNMGVALDRLGPDAAAVQPIFITVDPKRDTREALADYLKSFDPHIVALTGSEPEIAAAVKEYHVYVAAHPEEGANYSVDHSSLYYLISPDGKFAGILHGDLSGDELADRLRDSMKHTV